MLGIHYTFPRNTFWWTNIVIEADLNWLTCLVDQFHQSGFLVMKFGIVFVMGSSILWFLSDFRNGRLVFILLDSRLWFWRMRQHAWFSNRAFPIVMLEGWVSVLWDVSCLDPLLMVFFSKFRLPLLLGGHHETVFVSDDVLIMIDGWDIVQHLTELSRVM